MKNFIIIFFLTAGFLISSCEKESQNPEYEIPTTYQFENVSYSGQTDRLGMLHELQAEIKKAATENKKLSKEQLIAMYTNNVEKAGWQGTYSDSKQLKNKTFPAYQELFTAVLADAADKSQNLQAASEGQAGIITNEAQDKQYFVNENGLEYAQIVAKGLMGSLLYYQATAGYLGDARINVDNETVTPGRGTDMEHHWDEAFGYWGVPIDFPQNTDGLYFWGSYTNGRSGHLGISQPMMDAFIKGRAAISAGDIATRDEQRKEIKKLWEKVAASSAIHYMNGSYADYEDTGARLHQLSEGTGFIFSLLFNDQRSIDEEEVFDLIEKLGGSRNLLEINLYNATRESILEVRNWLSDRFDMEGVKTAL